MHGATGIGPASVVTEIVKKDYRTADVFRKYGIEYCCGGMWPLEMACQAQGADVGRVLEELERVTRDIRIPGLLDFGEWDIDFLSGYIINVHHLYLKKALPDIKELLAGYIEEHASQYPYIVAIEKHFLQLHDDLLAHLRYEEEVIFPYIGQIAHAYKNKESYAKLLVRTLRKPVREIMATEHKRIAGILHNIREQSNDYVSPVEACISHQVLLLKLKELDRDLEQHIYLEKDVLFPQAITMEKELLNHAD